MNKKKFSYEKYDFNISEIAQYCDSANPSEAVEYLEWILKEAKIREKMKLPEDTLPNITGRGLTMRQRIEQLEEELEYRQKKLHGQSTQRQMTRSEIDILKLNQMLGNTTLKEEKILLDWQEKDMREAQLKKEQKNLIEQPQATGENKEKTSEPIQWGASTRQLIYLVQRLIKEKLLPPKYENRIPSLIEKNFLDENGKEIKNVSEQIKQMHEKCRGDEKLNSIVNDTKNTK